MVLEKKFLTFNLQNDMNESFGPMVADSKPNEVKKVPFQKLLTIVILNFF